jgi:hypothetical protein
VQQVPERYAPGGRRADVSNQVVVRRVLDAPSNTKACLMVKRFTSKISEKKSVEEQVMAGTWWPFDRVDAKLLEKINRKRTQPKKPDLPAAPF